ncbi:MAG: peptidylprolyl isomerase [Candidatus Azobacteroides sp.]|nr:peptidylprolyl isomerase [Candidatus Azobacteroides sp.]
MKSRFFPLVLLLSSAGVFAQANDPVIMTINGKNYKKSEFEYFYNKYNNEDVIDKRSLKDYIDLFKDLKLKVAEAESQGLDTTASFRAELFGYRATEAKPYLDDLEINEELVRKEYNRMKDLIEVSHILVAFPKILNNDIKVFPSDTLETYNKAVQIRNRILKGEDFEKIAAELSDDKNTSKKERPGYLGWFTGLDLNPPFEEVAFNTPVGSIGQLTRSNLGYHIIKVHAKKENPGRINAAHILIPCPADADTVQAADAWKKINEIYDELMKGADFSALAKEYSKDPGSASKGGELGFFGYGTMVKEFQDAAFGLKEIGAVSKPFRTQFGYHIVKLLDRKPLESFEEKRKDIEAKLNSGGYFIPLHQPGIENMKKEYGFQKEDAGYQQLFSQAKTVYPTDSLFYAAFENSEMPLLTVDDTRYSAAQFINYLKKNVRSPFTMSTDLLDDRLQWFEYNALNEAKNKSLESKYPEFKNLIQEYRDGILMFEISNKEVWGKASDNAEDLSAYFEKNKKNYVWDEPFFKGYVVLAKDAKTKKKMQKEIARMQPDEAAQYLYDNYKVGGVSYVKVEKGLFKKGDNAFVDEAAFQSGVAERPAEFQDFFLIGKILREPESYMDVRGPVMTDYQNYLEEIWIKSLNEKYKVTVYPEVIETIK